MGGWVGERVGWLGEWASRWVGERVGWVDGRESERVFGRAGGGTSSSSAAWRRPSHDQG